MSLKKNLFLLFTCLCFQVYAENSTSIKDPAELIDNEVLRLDSLIQATELSLESQKKLRGQIIEYQKLQDQYLQNHQDNDLLLKLVKSAYRTFQTIKENHLTQTFDSDFIDELSVLSKPATKRGIPKP